jgi:hypothetical protein
MIIPKNIQSAIEDMQMYSPEWLRNEVENCIEEASSWEEAKEAIENNLTDLIQEINKVRNVFTCGKNLTT